MEADGESEKRKNENVEFALYTTCHQKYSRASILPKFAPPTISLIRIMEQFDTEPQDLDRMRVEESGADLTANSSNPSGADLTADPPDSMGSCIIFKLLTNTNLERTKDRGRSRHQRIKRIGGE